MDSHILAIRSVASSLAKKFLLPIIIVASIVFILILSVLLWIASEVGVWMLLLIIPVAFIGLAIGLALFVIYKTVSSIGPKNTTKDQKKATKLFIADLEGYAELKNTPKIFILWKIIMSALRQSPREYVSSIIGESTKLKTSYSSLVSAYGGSSPGRKKVKNLAEDK